MFPRNVKLTARVYTYCELQTTT